VAELGSLSKAAEALNTSQPTLGRQIARLEQQIGLTLFDRSTQGLKLTSAGEKFIETSDLMSKASEQFARIASGGELSLSGNLRITANEVIGLYYLPKLVAQFSQSYPNINVEIDISNQSTSLHKRDADVALRMFRPTQPDLIARRLKDIELCFVASNAYISKSGQPQNMQDLKQHQLIGYDRELDFIKAIQNLNWPLTEKSFSLKTDFLPLQIELARKGAGISVTHRNLLNQWPELETVLTGTKIPNLEFWLVCHKDVQHNRKIRLLMDFLAKALGHS
jgi:DNA-binding transcriptional LysR family regulator